MSKPITTQWRSLHDEALAAGQRSSDPNEALTAFSKAFRMLLQSTILTLGAFLVLRGEITAGSIIAASLLSGRALAPVDQAVGQLRGISNTWAAHCRLAKHFEALPEPAPSTDLPAPTGQISLNGITKFAPGTSGADRKRLLTQIDFALEPGDGLGVIGNSASGKSTLAKLLVGVWEPDMGNIRMDGATRDQWDPAVLGAYIGYMPQSFVMLPGTIRNNIARFAQEVDDTLVIDAAKMAGVHEMILALPEGYQTFVGGMTEAGQLSGGQVQRIGLARALFGKPALVVLDEPNANLDTTGDQALTAAIRAMRKAGTTVVVMAHRPSAIAAVNKVLVLNDGKQMQFGPRDEVLGKVLAEGAARQPQDNAPTRAATPPRTPDRAQAEPAAPGTCHAVKVSLGPGPLLNPPGP
ncbi:MAG: ATP-binding cassette domain-containing protein [Paracoccaceae bacterium]|nr:ATP-binding cassette domain-containing protein [Paracoccaceae bacterium]